MGPRNLMILFFSTLAVSLVILIIFFSLFFKNVDLSFDTKMPDSAPDLGNYYKGAPSQTKGDNVGGATIRVPQDDQPRVPSSVTKQSSGVGDENLDTPPVIPTDQSPGMGDDNQAGNPEDRLNNGLNDQPPVPGGDAPKPDRPKPGTPKPGSDKANADKTKANADKTKANADKTKTGADKTKTASEKPAFDRTGVKAGAGQSESDKPKSKPTSEKPEPGKHEKSAAAKQPAPRIEPDYQQPPAAKPDPHPLTAPPSPD